MNPFVVGQRYTREQIQRAMGEKPSKGGNWHTGYHRKDNMVFIFSTIGVEARTGHAYGDRWLPDGRFEWFGKTGSKIDQPLINFMVGEDAEVFLFTREGDREAFEFKGRATADAVFNETPVRVLWRL